VYRRLLWSAEMVDNFRQYIWERISEFVFTLNWDRKHRDNALGKVGKNLGKFISESLERKVNDVTI
jgi:hypothetical protein